MSIISLSVQLSDYAEQKLKQASEAKAKLKGFICIQMCNLHAEI